jgi:hypothetical protein
MFSSLQPGGTTPAPVMQHPAAEGDPSLGSALGASVAEIAGASAADVGFAGTLGAIVIKVWNAYWTGAPAVQTATTASSSSTTATSK